MQPANLIPHKEFYCHAVAVFSIHNTLLELHGRVDGTGFLSHFQQVGHPLHGKIGIYTAYHVFDPRRMYNINMQNTICSLIQTMNIKFFDPIKNSMSDSFCPLSELINLSAKYVIAPELDFVFFEIKMHSVKFPFGFRQNAIPIGTLPKQNELTVLIQFPEILDGEIGFDVGSMGILDDSSTVTYEVSTANGSSGSPVLQFINGRFQAVALHLGATSSQESSNFTNIGLRFLTIIDYLRVHEGVYLPRDMFAEEDNDTPHKQLIKPTVARGRTQQTWRISLTDRHLRRRGTRRWG